MLRKLESFVQLQIIRLYVDPGDSSLLLLWGAVLSEKLAGYFVLCIRRVSPREYAATLRSEYLGIMRVVLLVILYINVLRVIFYPICRKLPLRLLMEGDEQDLIVILELLIHEEVFGFAWGTLVFVDDGHASNLVQGEADYNRRCQECNYTYKSNRGYHHRTLRLHAPHI